MTPGPRAGAGCSDLPDHATAGVTGARVLTGAGPGHAATACAPGPETRGWPASGCARAMCQRAHSARVALRMSGGGRASKYGAAAATTGPPRRVTNAAAQAGRWAAASTSSLPASVRVTNPAASASAAAVSPPIQPGDSGGNSTTEGKQLEDPACRPKFTFKLPVARGLSEQPLLGRLGGTTAFQACRRAASTDFSPIGKHNQHSSTSS
jgi:hypothetical protein